MELTIEQALEQGVAAHREGNLQDAERIYKAILQSQPKHPDANHNLGLIAVSVNKSDVALPLFKAALEANPKVEQFWLSYIDALIKEKQFVEARRVIEKAQKQGIARQKVDALGKKLTLITATEESTSREQKKTLTFSEKRKKLAENKQNKKRRGLKDTSPSDTEINTLLQHYQHGEYGDAEQLAVSLTERFPKHPFSWKVLGLTLTQLGRVGESLTVSQKSVKLAPKDGEAHSNLGIALTELGRLNEAEVSYRRAIALAPDYTNAHNNLANTLKALGRLDEAEASYKQAIALEPSHAEALNNLGITLKDLGRLGEAEASYRQAIAFKPDFAEAHSNLGIMLNEQGRRREAVASYNRAIALRPDLAEAHFNLGNTFQEQGNLGEAETSLRQTIALRPDHAEAHINLGTILYANGDIDAAIESLEKANDIDSKSRVGRLMLSILRARNALKKNGVSLTATMKSEHNAGLSYNPLCLNRVVEPELLLALTEMQSRKMDEAENTPVFGNGRCSLDYDMFEGTCPIIKTVEADLIRLIEEAVKSEIYLYDAFFNIYGAEAGIPPHTHITEFDKNRYLNFGEQKYSLVYYLSVGDQNCSDPGLLKLYDPDEEILPCDGMIVIFPASRLHSAVYNGAKDRIIIGINFYIL